MPSTCWSHVCVQSKAKKFPGHVRVNAFILSMLCVICPRIVPWDPAWWLIKKPNYSVLSKVCFLSMIFAGISCGLQILFIYVRSNPLCAVGRSRSLSGHCRWTINLYVLPPHATSPDLNVGVKNLYLSCFAKIKWAPILVVNAKFERDILGS